MTLNLRDFLDPVLEVNLFIPTDKVADQRIDELAFDGMFQSFFDRIS